MKRFCSVLLASAVVATAVPAMAFESKFGGYWRTRAFTQGDYAANETADTSRADSRTRLYYTAEFSKNFKLVNRFELDAIWGSKTYYDKAPGATDKPGSGAIGADSLSVEVKNTYADFTPVDNLNFKIGTQGAVLCRGFLFNDDFSGAVITYDANPVKIPFLWLKYSEGGPGVDAVGDKMNDQDMDVYAIAPEFSLGNIVLNPVVAYQYQDATNTELYSLALNADLKTDAAKAWFTGIYQGGSVDGFKQPGALVAKDTDFSSYLIALGAEMNIDKLNIHAQGFYASGDDDANDSDCNGYYGFNKMQGQDYHWAEIMGGGLFDNQVSTNAANYNQITNTSAVNVGASFKAMDRLTLGADIWYAQLVEDVLAYNGKMESELGTEVDLKARYMIFENLALDVVGAYLFAGDATGKDDPYEVGTQLELKF